MGKVQYEDGNNERKDEVCIRDVFLRQSKYLMTRDMKKANMMTDRIFLSKPQPNHNSTTT